MGSHALRSTLILLVVSAIPGAAVALPNSCSATAGNGATCSVTCGDIDEFPVCTAGKRKVSCYCDVLEGVASLMIEGSAPSGASIRSEIRDHDGVLHASAVINVSAGADGPAVATALFATYFASLPSGCSSEVAPLAEGVFELTCPSFQPLHRLCVDTGSECPLVFEEGTGTDPQLGIDIAGLHFVLLESLAVDAADTPAVHTYGVILIAGSLGALGASVLRRAWSSPGGETEGVR